MEVSGSTLNNLAQDSYKEEMKGWNRALESNPSLSPQEYAQQQANVAFKGLMDLNQAHNNGNL